MYINACFLESRICSLFCLGHTSLERKKKKISQGNKIDHKYWLKEIYPANSNEQYKKSQKDLVGKKLNYQCFT